MSSTILSAQRYLCFFFNGTRRGRFIDGNVRHFIDIINAGSRGDDILKLDILQLDFCFTPYHAGIPHVTCVGVHCLLLLPHHHGQS